jgi:hypothetical protein
MTTFLLKLILAPSLVGIASLAGRRWGPAVSGWLVGLPMTSAPIAFLLALSHGTGFAASAALGTLSGTTAEVIFCLCYAWLSLRFDWPVALALASLSFAGSAFLIEHVTIPLLPLFLIQVAALMVGLRLLPTGVVVLRAETPPRWDMPMRMIMAAGFVLLVTGVAPIIGPRMTGLLAIFPLYTSILTAFAHHQHGPYAAVSVLRGLLFGLFAFTGFYLTLAALIEPSGIGAAFAASVVAALAIQAVTYFGMRVSPNSVQDL